MEYINDNVILIRNYTFLSNTYLLYSNKKKCIIIDPGLDLDLIKLAIENANLSPIAVISTHGHFDHIGSVVELCQIYGICFFMHSSDLKLAKSANFFIKLAKLSKHIQIPEPTLMFDKKINHFTIQDFSFEIINFPGHSNGSCIIRNENFLFSGDILYEKGLGFNHFPGEDANKLRNSIKEIRNYYNLQSLLLPGHGKHTTLSNVFSHNYELVNFLNK